MLGKQVLIVMISFRGHIKDFEELSKDILRVARLKEVHKSTLYKYPVDKRGGVGVTFIKPFTESFLVIDTWEDLNGGYLIICSCKLFWVRDVVRVLESYGLRIVETKVNEIGIQE